MDEHEGVNFIFGPCQYEEGVVCEALCEIAF